MPQKKVTIIVVTFNSSKYLDGLFGSLAKINEGDLFIEVLVVDNGSVDGTVGMIREKWPWVDLHEAGVNLGFAAGNNLGIRVALDRRDDYVYLLNADTEVERDFLVEAVAAMETDASIGSAQSLLLLHPERELVNSAGNAIHFLGFGYCDDYRRPVEQVDRENIRDIAYPSGAGVLLRCSALRQVGLFDEQLFMYHEDLDLGWRLRLAGYRNVLAPRSVVWHKYEFSRSIKKWYLMERNRYIVLFKNLRAWSLLVLAPGLLATELFMLLPAVRGGWWPKKFKALAYFLTPAAWQHIWRERASVSGLRRIGDRQVMALFTSEIRDQDGQSPFVMFVANPLMNRAWWLCKKIIR
jgi:GT2 family glycosyltransferase